MAPTRKLIEVALPLQTGVPQLVGISGVFGGS